jgi:hypothetical protein
MEQSSQAEPPSATRANRSWSEVFIAAGLEGAIYALVKASAERERSIVRKSNRPMAG